MRDVFLNQHHLPPDDAGDIATVLDLGSHIGLTMLHYSYLYPTARIIGVEADDENYALLELNIASQTPRVVARRGAVWSESGTIGFRRSAFKQAGMIQQDGEGGDGVVAAISLDDLLAQEGLQDVDYVKMDIEGAEALVLRENTSWAACVRLIRVAVHAPYTTEDCSTALRDLGFSVSIDGRFGPEVLGVRRASLPGNVR